MTVNAGGWRGRNGFFQWDGKYSVGRGDMDGHHQKLFDIINRLHDSMKAGTGRESAGPLLRELADYGALHFKAEEKVISEAAPADLAAQKGQHKYFIDKVEELKGELEAGKLALSLEMMAFLRDWLANHILALDKKYAMRQ